ncbi:class I SAM-dependent methyltransferase [Sphingomonas sp. RHCKR7]|uniref:methyltransferase domain-containing protein n=1 Tax=Sphingomonas folli TaxID=2862497 RepID=UPI001C669474|nr:methyltransferase domain-containing protein [Sphingomonas folli]MBW6526383.1 class I SAM-dependent methyltransferase [Sphingomonas folli]
MSAIDDPRPARDWVVSGPHTVRDDPRWLPLLAALADLRQRHRCSVRIVDADCGSGALLIEAAREARALGFTAIEARGIDGSPAMIARARSAAGMLRDRAIGLTFDQVDMAQALAQEAVFPADIVLWHGTSRDDHRAGLGALLSAAGDRVVGDPAAASIRGVFP